MKNENNNIEDLLNAFDGINNETLKPFFYTRFKQRLENKNSKNSFLKLKPALLIAVLSFLLLINCITVYMQMNERKNSAETAQQKSFANNYNLTISSY